MDLGYSGILAVWYDTWLSMLGFVVALAVAFMVVVREDWRGPGPAIVAVLVLLVIAALPLVFLRMGMALMIEDTAPVGYISLIGTPLAIALGIARLYQRWAAEREALDDDSVYDEYSDVYDGGHTMTVVEDVTPQPGLDVSTPADPLTAQGTTAWLRFTSGPKSGQSIPLSTGTVNLGRGIDNDVVLDDASVSRSHATIAFQGDQYYIEDAGSMSGTLVEGVPATRTVLASGATLKIGDSELVFMRTEGDSPLTESGTGASGTGPAGPGETVVMQRAGRQIMAWLAVVSGPAKGASYQLNEGDNTIGRSPDNDMVVEDTAISRRHALVRVQDDRIVLVDLGSSGGTAVGGGRLEGKVVPAGGVVTVGQTPLRVVQIEAQDQLEQGTMSGATIVDTPSGGSAVLIAQSGPDSGRSFNLSEGDNSIGRDPSSDVLLSDDSVSRRHSLIRVEADRIQVFDLGSRSGTVVDGELIQGHELTADDTISIGRSEIVLMRPSS